MVRVNGSALTRLRWFLFLGLLALAAAPWDAAFVRAVNPDEPARLDGFARWLDGWSTRLMLIGIALALFGAYTFRPLARLRFATAHFLAGWLGTELVVQVLKRLAGRPRPVHPDGIVESLRPLFDNPDTKSFPSGHTATAVAVAVWICIHVRSRTVRGFFVLFAVLIALGRCYIGAHYLSDILAGAAIGWAAMSVTWHGAALLRPRLEKMNGPRAVWPLTLLAFLVIMSWLAKSPAVLTDWRTGTEAVDYGVSSPLMRSLLEPFVGLGLEVARVADLEPWARAAAVWFGLGAVVLGLRFGRRGLIAAGIIGVWGAVNAWVAINGVALGERLRVRGEADRVVFDLQSHGGDAVDGKVDLETSLARFGRLGIDLAVPTHHNRWSQGRERTGGGWRPVDLWGMEWSPGDHMLTPLHVLVYNTKPVPVELGTDLTAMVRAVHAAGGVVVMSHYWRGDAARLPSIEELIATGVDGFEVAGRNQEVAPDILARQAAIRDAVERHDLVALANSDWHGRRSAHYQWNAVARREGETRAGAVWRALKDRGRGIDILTLESSSTPTFLATAAHPPFTLIGYFRGMPTGGRAVWILLLTACGFAWLRLRRVAT